MENAGKPNSGRFVPGDPRCRGRPPTGDRAAAERAWREAVASGKRTKECARLAAEAGGYAVQTIMWILGQSDWPRPERKVKPKYDALRAAGVCVKCAQRAARQGKTKCAECAAVDSRRAVEYARRNRESVGRYRKEWYHQNKDRIRPLTNAKSKRWREAHPDEARAARKRWSKTNPLRARNSALKTLYGITLDQWEALFDSQGRRCAICCADKPDGRGWSTDHNHATGEVRGILCAKCNAAIGMLRENPVFMERAARYVVIRGGANERQASLISKENT